MKKHQNHCKNQENQKTHYFLYKGCQGPGAIREPNVYQVPLDCKMCRYMGGTILIYPVFYPIEVGYICVGLLIWGSLRSQGFLEKLSASRAKWQSPTIRGPDTRLLSGVRFIFFGFWAPIILPVNPKNKHIFQGPLNSQKRPQEEEAAKRPQTAARLFA